MLLDDPSLAPAERGAAGGTAADGLTLVELFEAQAARTPAAEALVHGRERLAYGELNRRANRLARLLRARGVGPEARVAVLLERSPRLVTALLAILKAGGAYVPLDPAWPRERTAFLLADSGAALLVTGDGLAPEAAGGLAPEPARILDLDREETALAAQPGTDLPDAPDPRTLAYLLYTSGSTGRPKGVAIEHRCAANLVRWAAGLFAPDELAGMLASTSICFDLSVFELFVPLCLGGRVILAGNLFELPLLPAAGEITFVNTVPSLLAELLRQGPLPPSVGTVALAGEPLRRELCDRLYAQPSVAAVLNLYGPSETTTYATAARITRGEAGPPPIGRAVDGLRMYVLDGELRPLPAGEPGELYIAGAGVARGYLGQPGQTVAAFLPDPFAADPSGARMYRTGDLVCWRPDGQLEFMGRIDGQVKLRGLRIEPGEIESVLGRHPAVRHCAVIARGDRPGDKRLVAYVVLLPGQAPGARDLLRHLAASLPSYMVPADCVLLDVLPLTPSGKLDRRALPAPAVSPPASPPASPSEGSPHDPVEAAVAAVCADILGLAEVGAADDFFALGGNSLHSAMVLARVGHQFGVFLPAHTLLVERTAAGLARAMSAVGGEAGDEIPLRRLDRRLQRLWVSAGGEILDVAADGAVLREGFLLPASFAQQRMWFLERLEPGTAVQTMAGALDLAGPCEPARLHRALAGVMARHEPLRTTFVTREAEPLQLVAPAPSLSLPCVDLGGLPPEERRAEAARWAAVSASLSFDLVRGPRLCAWLLRLGAGEHRLLLALHHAVADAWSIDVLVRELAALYGAGLGAAGLPELAVQYGDHARWQRDRASSAGAAAQLAYWRRRLQDAPPPLELPVDRARQERPVARAGSCRVALSPPAEGMLRSLLREAGATLFMGLHTLFVIFLTRLTGEEDIALGIPVTGRSRLELEPLIGLFVNTLVLRVRAAPGLGLRELLQRVRETSLEAMAHQEVPFERLVEELQPERSASHGPLVQILFALSRSASPVQVPDGPRMRWSDSPAADLGFDLVLDLKEDADGVHGVFQYRADAFDDVTVRRMAAQLSTLVEAAVRDPGAPIANLALLPPDERHALLHEWSRSLDPPSPPVLAHAAFAARAAAAPGAVALDSPAGSVTYGELDVRTDRWAASLQRLGVGPEKVVGIFLERSPEAAAAILAVLKAGGAFLPLDPAYPRERLAWMLADSGAVLVVTRHGLADKVPETTEPVAFLDTLDSETGPGAAPAPCRIVSADLLAYVIYTSGSTGRPKGVAISHRGVGPMVSALNNFYDIGEDSRLLLLAPISFDAAVADVLPVLSAGGTLVCAEPEALLPGLDLLETLRRLRVTNLTLVPSALAALPVTDLPDLRSLVVAGEACPAELTGRWIAPGRLFIDAYGPTEATICAAAGQVEDCGRKPDVGRAVADSRLYILDRHFEPVPIGALGELFIGGAGVARGYLNRPDLTAERFLPDPWSGEPGGRCYRTGDRVRFLANGRLDFLGRVDEQVKVRGFRIELGEIEALLLAAPNVREAAAVTRPDSAGGTTLLAYVSGDVDTAALRRSLKEHLPAYMVPAAVVVLPELPRTPSGKLDRRALPAPLAGGGGSAASGSLHGPVQELLAQIWSELLGVSAVRGQDHFFDLGGHSLLATRLASQVRRLLGVDLQVRTVFEAPTLARLAQRIEEARHAGMGGPEPPPLVRIPRDRPLPLTFGQERLWFLHRLEPGSPAYNLPVAFDVAGPLGTSVDSGALARAVAGVVARHEVLRTTYVEAGGEVVQIVHQPVSELPLVDLSGLAPARRIRARELISAAEDRRPFNLVRGPILRPLLLRLAQGEHRLLLTVHHIAADAWSLGVLTAELQALYTAFVSGRPADLPQPDIQVADFAAWQREWMRDATLDELLGRWVPRLADAPIALDLPADRPRPPVRSDRGGVRSLPLPQALTAAVRRLGRSEGATPYMVLLAALAALLGRWTGQRDFLVGTPIAGRNRAELEGLIGFFVNTLVLRCDLRDGALSFRELLARVREECLEAQAVQDLPFEKLVERLQPLRDPSRNPLFQVLFVLQNSPAAGAATPEGLPLEPVDGATGTAKFDLTLEAVPAGESFRLLFEYSTDLFDAATIERMAGHFQRLLADAAERPGEELGDLSLLSGTESHQLLREWNDSAAGYGPPVCLHQLVEDQVDRTPDAVAVVFAGESLTYAELDRQANRLAHRLLRLGVEPDSPVGVCAERSLELEIALLAILKAGAAYLPLDPEYPRERLAYMLEDALGDLAAPVLLTQSRLLPLLPATRPRTVLLDELPDEEPCHRPAVPVHLDQAAYLIYTSGSTGRPKGVVNSHRGIANRLLWMQEKYRLDGSDVVLQKTPASFDVSVWEFFWPLLAGARLVIALPGGHRDPVYLARTIAEEGVTTLHFVPSMLSLFLAAPEVGRCASLRRVVCSGEALPYELQQRFEARHGCRLENLYGPTEAAVDVTFWTCRRGGPPVVPIGRPMANTRIHLLDGDAHPVPAGVPGELHISGIQLARGYWRRPELTAERFVPDPCAGEAGSRLYKTGDLARHRPDGAIEYLGRLDHQVKVRGVRVELGEIEAVLAEHPEVREAVVAARSAEGDTKLVAWVVPSGAAPDRHRLAAALRARLPEPMMPAAWVFLPAMPLTPSGKVDRSALPEPGEEPRGKDTPFLAPRTPAEEVVAGVWSDVMGIEAVGILDDFFALGGHSLLAARVALRLGTAFGVEIPLRRLFEAPTVAALAEIVEAARWEDGAANALPPIEPSDRSRPLPLSFAQERLWFLDRLAPGLPVYNLPVLFELAGRLDAGALAYACGEIVRRHEALRTTFTEGPCQVVAPPAQLSLPYIDLSGLAELRRAGAARALAMELARHPFDLALGPLARFFLLRLAREEHQLLLVAHHIVCDGWSLEVLAGELATFYQVALARVLPPLAELPVQYADFVLWQRLWLFGEVLEAPLRFWRERLRDLPEVLDLPLDRPRPPRPSFRGGTRSRALPPAPAAALRLLGRRAGATFFMTALAGCAALLHRLTGQVDLPVGTPVANRDRPEIEPLIGLFVNSLVLRCDTAGDPLFSSLLERVRATALEAYAHQALPFERLVAELQPRRELSHTPLFQVVLLAETARERELAPGIHLRELPVDNGTAKFDLTFHLLAGVEELSLSVEFNGDLFDPATAERLLALWSVLLEGAAADPARPLSDLPLLPPEEAWQILGEWSHAPAPPLPPACVHELFAAQAARAPEDVALVSAGAATTYRELDARANHLAHRLRALGVGLEDPVAVTLERSPELVTVLLAVLKAGGAYVPVDPAYPQARLASLLADAGVRALVTAAALLPALRGLPAGVPVLCLDREEEEEEEVGLAAAPPAPAAGPEQLAYILFTSGSTGRPKGVAVPHRAIVRLVLGDASVRSGAEETFLQLAPASFDASTLEIWGPLLTGGRLVVAPPGRLSVDEIAGAVAAGGVTTLWLTAGLFHQVVDEGLERLRGLRRLLAGGDVLSPIQCRRALATLPGTALINGYGPTENTTFTCLHPMHVPEEAAAPVSIGRPIPWTSIWVVDRSLRPVPVGVPGELVTGGLGLARGYHGRPEPTAELFIPDPLSGERGARLYRTGDLVRWRPDGTLEFLGRLDRQVKIRGFRIEPGEIENALAEHPGVRAAVVMPCLHPSGERALVAWIETAWAEPGGGEPAGAPAAEELRGFLVERLPGFMIPAAFQILAALPLGASGKVDRGALPAPDWGATAGEEARRAFRTQMEEMVAGIWAEILGRDSVGLDDDVFTLGAHSLLATRAVSRLRAALGMEVALRHLFESPTVATLAAVLEEELRQGAPPLPPLTPAPRGGPLPLSFGQQRLWFLDQLAPGNPTFNIPLPARLSGPLDAAALAWSLAEVVRRHEVLRTTFLQEAGKLVQAVAPPPAAVPLPLIDLQGLPEAARETEARRLAGADGQRPFDLARGPLLRATLVRLARESSWLSLCLHHIAADGWSVDVLLAELVAGYEAALAGRPSPLPPLPVQYADYAIWQRGLLRGEALDRRLDYWRSRLGGSLPVLDLAPGQPAPAETLRRGALLTQHLPAALGDALRRFARQQGATLYMVLLAAFGELLRRQTGATDLLVGTPISRRDIPALEPLIGFLVDTLVLRLDVSGDPDFRTLTGRVREVALGAYTHADLPFDRLVEELHPDRAAGASPLFQVMFALHTPQQEEWTLGGARLTPVEIHNDTSQFDWTLYVVDSGGELTVLLEYDRDRFDAATACKALAGYGELLEAAVADPERPASALAPGFVPARPQAPAAPPPAPAPRAEQTGRKSRIAEMRGQLTPEQRELLERRLQGKSAPAALARISLVSLEPDGERPPLVCVHPAGGDVLGFRGLARHLGPGQPVLGLQSRGLVEGQEPQESVTEMAASYIAELQTAHPDGPYLLCGWSLGGLVAYEMARQLQASSGAAVPLLALLDSVPRLPVLCGQEAEDENDDTPWLMDIADYVEALAGSPDKRLGLTRDGLRAMGDPEKRLRLFTERLAAAGMLPPGGTVEHLRRLLRVFRANVRAGRQYVPSPWTGRATLFRAGDSPRDAGDPTAGWGALSARVEVEDAPGNHLTLLAEPHVQALAARLRAIIDAVLEERGKR